MRIGLEAKLEARLKGRVGRQAGLVRGDLQSPVGGWECALGGEAAWVA